MMPGSRGPERRVPERNGPVPREVQPSSRASAHDPDEPAVTPDKGRTTPTRIELRGAEPRVLGVRTRKGGGWTQQRIAASGNPFYLISACLVFYGLRTLFPTAEDPTYAWTLSIFLMLFTGVLAVTAVAIVRLGRVWDDARSILLIIALLFVALSVSCDGHVVESLAGGSGLLAGGLLFAVLVSEGVLRGLRLALPLCYRVPYYALLALFFGYPLFLTLLLQHGSHTSRELGLVGFTPAVALVLLGLLFAVRRGGESRAVASRSKDSVQPWAWPWYPWALFGLLTVAAGLRAYLLSVSFAVGNGAAAPFAPYLLIPLVLAIGTLAVAAAARERHPRLRLFGLCMPPLAFLLAIIGADHGPALLLLEHIVVAVDSPVRLTWVASLMLYAFAWSQGSRQAPIWLLGCFAAGSTITGGTISVATLTEPQAVILLPVGVLLLAVGLRQRVSALTFVGMGVTLGAACLAFEGTWFTRYAGLLPLHLFLASTIVMGALYRDDFAQILEHAGAIALTACAPGALCFGESFVPGISLLLLSAYASVIVLVLAGYGLLLRSRIHLQAASGCVGLVLVVVAWKNRASLATIRWPAGLGTVLCGTAALGVAIWVSGVKARVRRVRARVVGATRRRE